MKPSPALLIRLMFCFGVISCALVVSEAAEPAGKNIALGKSYQLFPSPNYRYCTDPGDKLQLTDGKTTSSYFWTQEGTVGWRSVQYATVTIDLGRVEPIAGVSITTAAGRAGVTWPMAIHVLLSDDGRSYRDAGDLVALDHKRRGSWPEDYAIRRVWTDELQTHGRFVQLVIIPSPGGPYTFTDEIEVFRGASGWLDREPAGPIVDAKHVYEKGRLCRAIMRRFQNDARAVEAAIRSAKSLPPSDMKRLLERIGEAENSLKCDEIESGESFHAVLPFSPSHAKLFAVQADLWRSLGRPTFTASAAGTWDPLDPFGLPPESPCDHINVELMRGEGRAAAVNLYSAADLPLKVSLRFTGLSDSYVPKFIRAYRVDWTDTSTGIPIAAALSEIMPCDDRWEVKVQPGLVQQVWFSINPNENGKSMVSFFGRLLVDPQEGEKTFDPMELPFGIVQYPFGFPKKTTLRLGGWSYTDVNGRGVTDENREALISHLKNRHVNAPWATSAVLRSCQFDLADPTKIQLDTTLLDRWIDQWPDAASYMVFLSVAHHSGPITTTLGGMHIESDQFDRRIGTWITAWVEHLRTKGISPDRLAILIHDEPHEGSDISAFLAWARAIKRAQPDVVVWEDPTYRDPTAAPVELFEACDVLCPNRPMWLDRGESFERFYRGQQARGRTLQFYSCSGPAKLLDPYSYYRLQAWHALAVGATGSYFWAFGDNSGASSWNEYYAKAGPYTPLFLDDRTVTAGKHMEAIRESAQDYEYFVMLGKAVEKAKAEGKTGNAIARAEALLSSGPAEVLDAENADRLKWHEEKDRTVADRTRSKVLQALWQLENIGQ